MVFDRSLRKGTPRDCGPGPALGATPLQGSGPRGSGRGEVPIALKLAFTAFCAALIPTYLVHYGPTNFLYFCDEAMLLTLVGIWTGTPLLVSMAAVGILVPQVAWTVDFVATAAGHPLLGLTAYMFDARWPLFLRVLSSFHGWLPLLLLFLVGRLGYDRRALPYWTIVATASIAVSFIWMPPPSPLAGTMPVNIDYVWGLSDAAPQTLMPAWAWVLMLTVGLPLLSNLPAHLVLCRLGRRQSVERDGEPVSVSACPPRPDHR